tara:strand:+ start:63 stop:434 length:372 start_codon:yes stop_codon:yes gene_type:complete
MERDYTQFLKDFEFQKEWDDLYKCDVIFDEDTQAAEFQCIPKADMVNSPDHYTKGKQEAIDIIEEAIADAPGPKTGLLQGNALKYLLRLWHKENALQDAKKARWYLDRLIEKLEGNEGPCVLG